MQPVTPQSRLLETGSKSHLREYYQVFVQKTRGYGRFEMNDAIAYFLFFFFSQHETGEKDCKPDWRSWETLSTWHTSTQDVRSCQSTTIFSMTISPFCTESAHVWISWRALRSSLLCSFHLLCLLFICSTPHVGLCLPANTVRFTPREVAEEGEQQAGALFKHGTCGCTAAHLCGNIGRRWPRSKLKMKMKAQHWEACSLSAPSTPCLHKHHLTTGPQDGRHDYRWFWIFLRRYTDDSYKI